MAYLIYIYIYIYNSVINTEYSRPDLGLATGDAAVRPSHLISRSEQY
jgi:hypothetical protein